MLPREFHRAFDQNKTFRDAVVASGIPLQSKTKFGYEYACEDCVQSGKFQVRCAMCKRQILSNEIEEAVGDPPEYLCTTCYATHPAKAWAAMLDELEQRHRWDSD